MRSSSGGFSTPVAGLLLGLCSALGAGCGGGSDSCVTAADCSGDEICLDGRCARAPEGTDGGRDGSSGGPADASSGETDGGSGGADAASCEPSSCDDGIACTMGTCGEDGCEHVPDDAACDDDNPCTDDVCDPTEGCRHPDDDGAVCGRDCGDWGCPSDCEICD